MLNLGLITGIISLSVISLAIGPVDIGLSEITAALFGRGEEIHRIIVIDIRLPRTILAIAVGATLASAGAVLQAFIRNPLASPSLLGASNAAAFGAVLVLSAGLGGALTAAVSFGAVFMAFVCVFILLLLTSSDQKMLTLILAGLALASLFGALTSLALNLTANPFGALEIAFWLLGSLSGRSFDHVWLGLPFMAGAWLLFALSNKSLSGLTLGEDTARTLGINFKHLRFMVIGGVALGTGGAVAISGVIGFVGLVVPHIIRPLVGYHPDRVTLPAGLAGACLLLASDCLVRVIPAVNELRLGVITALIGVPFFLWLVFKNKAVYAASSGAT